MNVPWFRRLSNPKAAPRFMGGRLWTMGALFFILVCRPAGTALAEDLMDVYRLALQNDPVYQSQVYRHEAAPETVTQAYADLLPRIDAELSYAQNHQEIKYTDVAVFGDPDADYPSQYTALTLTQPLWRYPSIQRVLQAKDEVSRADLEFEVAKQDLILRVAQTYLDALQAYDNLEVTRAEEEAVELHFALAKGRFESGLAPVTDFYDAKARRASVQALRIRLETQLEDALEALVQLSGREIYDVARLNPVETGSDARAPAPAAASPLLSSPDPDDLASWVDAAEEQNPSVKAQQLSVTVADREIKRQQARHWPNVDVRASYNREDEGGSLFGGKSDVVSHEVMFLLNVPLFEGGAVVSRTREARQLHKATEQELKNEIRSARRTAKAAFLGVKAAIQNIEALGQSVVANRIALEAKKEGFKSGLFTSLNVLDAERDYRQAELEYAKAHYDYLLYRLQLKQAVGTLAEKDLLAVNAWLR